MIYNMYIIYHIIEFWIVFEQLAHTKCTNAQLHNFDICIVHQSKFGLMQLQAYGCRQKSQNLKSQNRLSKSLK